MQRIVDMPEGGGAHGGRDVWFRLELEGGDACEACLPLPSLESLIAGLRLYAAEAKALRERNAPGQALDLTPTWPLAASVQARPAEAGGLVVRVAAARGYDFGFRVPEAQIKPMLLALLRALAARAPQPG